MSSLGHSIAYLVLTACFFTVSELRKSLFDDAE